jgi:heme A synthase
MITVRASERRFGMVAWGILALNVAVILGGSIVRATDSGAGCGETWPGCAGEGTAMVIELTHRLTSALAFAGVVWLYLWARSRFPTNRLLRRTAGSAVGFITLEALIGAALVLFGWVEDDASVARAVVVSVHLTNTFLLLGSLTLTAWWGSGRDAPDPAGSGESRPYFIAGVTALLLIGMTGVLNALGDTLFPAESLSEGFADDFAEGAHFLVRLRVFHPIVAVVAGILLLVLARRLAEGRSGPIARAGNLVNTLVFVQLLAGIANLLLLTPLVSQIVHLLLADVLWIAFVILAAAAVAEQPSSRTESAYGSTA